MKTSENIEQLATALSIAQGMMEPAGKDAKSHQAKYATLLSVRESSRVALAKNDLSIIQAPIIADQRAGVITRLIHKSGQWIETELSIRLAKDDAHSIGSAITYARRYAMSSMLGIVADDDDDGALAMANHSKQIKPQLQPQESKMNVFDDKDMAMVDRVAKVLVQNSMEHLSKEFWDEIRGKGASLNTINEAIAKLKG